MGRAFARAFIVATLVPAVFPANARVDAKRVLALRLFPVSLVHKHVPAPRALSEVGAQVQGGYVLFGIEMRLKRGEVPTVDLNLAAESTLGDALGQILDQLKDYRLELVSDQLINIYPVGAKQDPRDLLNLRISRFDVTDAHPDNILTIPQMFMPELDAALRSPGQSGTLGIFPTGVGPGITLHMRDVTVRDILNAASEATEHLPQTGGDPLGWLCLVRSDPTGPGGRAYSWELHASVPHEWRKQVPNGQGGASN